MGRGGRDSCLVAGNAGYGRTLKLASKIPVSGRAVMNLLDSLGEPRLLIRSLMVFYCWRCQFLFFFGQHASSFSRWKASLEGKRARTTAAERSVIVPKTCSRKPTGTCQTILCFQCFQEFWLFSDIALRGRQVTSKPREARRVGISRQKRGVPFRFEVVVFIGDFTEIG